MFKVKKGDIVYNLEQKIQARAFLKQGFELVEEEKQGLFDGLDLESMTVEQLKALAAENNIEIKSDMKKAEIIEALEVAIAETQE